MSASFIFKDAQLPFYETTTHFKTPLPVLHKVLKSVLKKSAFCVGNHVLTADVTSAPRRCASPGVPVLTSARWSPGTARALCAFQLEEIFLLLRTE